MSAFDLKTTADGFALSLRGGELIRHSARRPALYLGRGDEKIRMYRGNFEISDRVSERVALRFARAEGSCLVFTHPDLAGELRLTIEERAGLLHLMSETADARFNRLYLRVSAMPREHVTGGGEQFSALDLRGRVYPIWTREQGVGRNKRTEITRLADASDGGGGDYHTTFFPQPVFVSSRMYFLQLMNYEYAELDFENETFHELAVWSTRTHFVLGAGETYRDLTEQLTGLLGRQPMLPDWAMRGLWLGVQGGTERATEMERRCREHGVDLSAVWIQDWEGKRVTSFGKRLQWDWRWNEQLYPGLPALMAEYAGDDIACLGYINPYLVDDGLLFREGAEKGYFARSAAGGIYLVDFGEFNCGVVDFTNPEAFDWFKEIIKNNLIRFGLKGWMADFGEYLPTDVVLFSGEDPMLAHNAWPALWARCNYEALRETGMLGQALVFMRAGFSGTQRWCPLLWAGDQSVDFTRHDGLISALCGTLSAAMCGCGLNHSDIGGYTSLFGNLRTKELFLRWAEMAAFSPVMRTHEGNRPDENFQFYDEDDCLERFGRLTRLYAALAPYLRQAVRENCEQGVPVQRPLLLHYESEARSLTEQTEYLLGRDVLVAPVWHEGEQERTLWLPEDDWVHLWSGKSYGGGDVTVPAPLGYPAVFYREESPFAGLFAEIRERFA